MKKYSKLIWLSVLILIVLAVIFYGEDMARGFRDGYNSVPK
ncbi:MAG: hypothetical protein Q8S11_14205 [Daejeonella sp.]|nr:hypothetical protein [Daejeonella sp.]MDP3469489.1 hypothetical protein [Daejeonella sp.]